MFNDGFWSSLGVQLGRTTGKVVGGLVLVAVLFGGYWLWSQPPEDNVEMDSGTADSVSVAPAPRPFVPDREVTTTSPSGDRTTRPSESGPTKGTVTVTDTSSSDSTSASTDAALVIKSQDPWFPQWQSTSPVKRIGGKAAVVWTPPDQPFLDWSPTLTVGIGSSNLVPAAHVSLSLFTIADRVYLGAFARIPYRPTKSSVGVAVGTEIRRDLQLSVGIDHRRDPVVAFSYRF